MGGVGVVAATDLHPAFDQIEGDDGRVRGAATHDPAEAAQGEILPRAELATVALWNTVEAVRGGGQLFRG